MDMRSVIQLPAGIEEKTSFLVISVYGCLETIVIATKWGA